jgi:hypothetical protein
MKEQKTPIQLWQERVEFLITEMDEQNDIYWEANMLLKSISGSPLSTEYVKVLDQRKQAAGDRYLEAKKELLRLTKETKFTVTLLPQTA